MVVTLLLACSGPKEPAPSPDPVDTSPPQDSDTGAAVVDPATVVLDGPCPMATDFGGFRLESDALLTTLGGAVTDGVIPLTVLDPVAAAGDCELLRRKTLFCDPGCAADQTCGLDGECVPYPRNQDVGTVTVTGLFDEVEMEPSANNSYYALGLSQPPTDPGALVTLTARGSSSEGQFTLYGVGVVPLALEPGIWRLESGVDLELRWDNPGTLAPEVRSRVEVVVTIDQHGLTPVQLQCDFPDTGRGTVPGTLVADLVGFGATGFPAGRVTRRTSDALDRGEGCIDFEVGSAASAEIDVVGSTPCHDDEECPPGETCNTALEICE
jgi:hypothetical protein